VKLLVYMKDGRTVYLLEKRGRLAQLVNGEPWHENESVRAARGIWNPHTGEYVWASVPLRHIAKGSIAVVEEARGLDDVLPPESSA
jgi:hypothetical protein